MCSLRWHLHRPLGPCTLLLRSSWAHRAREISWTGLVAVWLGNSGSLNLACPGRGVHSSQWAHCLNTCSLILAHCRAQEGRAWTLSKRWPVEVWGVFGSLKPPGSWSSLSFDSHSLKISAAQCCSEAQSWVSSSPAGTEASRALSCHGSF